MLIADHRDDDALWHAQEPRQDSLDLALAAECSPARQRRFIRILDHAKSRLLFELPFWNMCLDGSRPDDVWAGVRLFQQDQYFIQKNPMALCYHYRWMGGWWTFGNAAETSELLQFQTIRDKWGDIPAITDSHPDTKWVSLDYLAREKMLTSACRERYRHMRMAIEIRVAEIEGTRG